MNRPPMTWTQRLEVVALFAIIVGLCIVAAGCDLWLEGGTAPVVCRDATWHATLVERSPTFSELVVDSVTWSPPGCIVPEVVR